MEVHFPFDGIHIPSLRSASNGSHAEGVPLIPIGAHCSVILRLRLHMNTIIREMNSHTLERILQIIRDLRHRRHPLRDDLERLSIQLYFGGLLSWEDVNNVFMAFTEY